MLQKPESPLGASDEHLLVWPTGAFWQESVVHVGDAIEKKQLLARGTTHIYFQANVWIFTFLVFVVGIMMGSKSDWEIMRHADEVLTQFGVQDHSICDADLEAGVQVVGVAVQLPGPVRRLDQQLLHARRLSEALAYGG